MYTTKRDHQYLWSSLNVHFCPRALLTYPHPASPLAPHVVMMNGHVWAQSFLSLMSAICALYDVSQPKDPYTRLSSLQRCETDRPALFIKHSIWAIIKQ